MRWIDLVLSLCGLPVLAASAYLAGLACLSRRRAVPSSRDPRSNFVVVIPAHNEESGIARTVESLKALDYPAERVRVLVVADNCSDHTADRAAAAGAEVLVRNDPERRGKGFALETAFNRILADESADAIVVVDADTVVSPNLLRAFAIRFERGAQAVQAEYGVSNPLDSWRTRLMTIALAAFHDVRSLGRERMGLSCGLRGNGMGFARRVLRDQPYAAFSLVEDLEYGVQLGYAGIRVVYVPEARVLGEMVSGERASRSQRRRWEQGRTAMRREHLPRLLEAAWQRRDTCLLDLALDLLVPPLTPLALITCIGFALTMALRLANFHVHTAPMVWALALLGEAFYVVRGWMLSGIGLRGVVDLLCVPVYVLWKVTLVFRSGQRRPQEWIRTSREARL